MAGGRIRAKIRRWWHGGEPQEQNGGVQQEQNEGAARVANAGNRARIAFNAGRMEPGTVADPELMAQQTMAAQKRNAGFDKYDLDLEKPEETVGEEENAPTEGLAAISRALKKSRGGAARGQNANWFNAVDQNLDSVLNQMNQSLSGDELKDRDILTQVMLDYTNLIGACRAYLGRQALSPALQARQEIIQELLATAEEDLQSIRGYGDSHGGEPAEERPKSVKEMIAKGRRRVIELNEGSKESDLRHVGGAVSYIARVRKKDAKEGSPSGYFKEEDIFTLKTNKQKTLDAIEGVRGRGQEISQEMYTKILTAAQDMDEEQASINRLKRIIPEYKTDRITHEFIDACYKVSEAYSTVQGFVTEGHDVYAGVDKVGDSANMSRRNVATSRVARLLGIGDLVAQSEVAELHYKDAQGQTQKKTGNLMQKAKGKEARKVLKDAMREDFMKKQKDDPGGGFELAGMDDKVSGEFLRSLTSLQVLDNLVAQVDHHNNNYMIDEGTGGKLGKVQAIDNDLAFGHKVYFGSEEGFFGHGRSIFQGEVTEENSSEARLRLPYMDRALAERILALREADVRMVLADVLEQGAIDAFCKRIRIVQEALKKEDLKGGHFLDGDEDWEREEVRKFFTDDSRRKDLRSGNGSTTYVGEFLRSSWDSDAVATTAKGQLTFEYSMAVVQEILQREKNLGEKGAFATPEKAKEFFKSLGINNAEQLDYWEKTGQLDGSPEVLKQISTLSLVSIANKEMQKRKAKSQNS